MISEKCDLNKFVEAIKDRPYHEVLTLTLREGYDSDDVLIHKKNEAPDDHEAIQQISEYNKAIHDFIFVLQIGGKPSLESARDKDNFKKFRSVAENLVKTEELLPGILNCFDD
ncbi:MAG: hypothetical protein ACXQT4_02995 [Methanotrichaceae archaeon]